MAMVAVANLLGKLSSPAIDEMKLIGGTEREVNEIKAELEFMKSFLQDADTKAETDEWVKTWVKQVRDVAYDTEDILDEYFLRLVRPYNQGIFGSFLNCFEYFKQLITRHFLATEIQHIKTRITTISERSKQYDFNMIVEGGTRVHTTSVQWHDPRIASLYIDEAEVVGIEGPKNIIIEWLTKGELKLITLSVVGMGGLGKTTLVKKVYDSQMVKKHFECHVWITVSQSPDSTRELLRKTIKGVLKATKEQAPEVTDEMDNNELIEVLKNQLLGKRYVIIFDDIWDINVWEEMQFAFPNNEYGNRIIFTTRIDKFVEYTNYFYDLEPLPKQEAWKLFCMKAFGSNHDSSSSCPEELEELSQNILKKCSGLPLAIVLIGGLLGRKAKTIMDWKNIHDSLGAEMRNDYDLEPLSRILLLSYNNLPYYLKPCFLYLSMFPEDCFIRRMTLIRMWIAEGFIKEKQGVTIEVVAGDYVNELISRSMIQIAKLNNCNEVKSYRIHDLVRETILSKSKEECFSTTNIGAHGMGNLNEKARRISIHHDNNIGDENNYNCSMGSRCSNIRSLMMFQLDDQTPRSFQRKFFNAFRLLRVLDLEGADLVVFPPELVELIHLRYLSLRRNKKIMVLPKSVGKLKNLETLDLKETNVSELPVEILKLQRLRHLLVYHVSSYFDFDNLTTNHRRGASVPTGRIGNLTYLQKLSYLDVQRQDDAADSGVVVLKELGKLTQLRKLGITNLRMEDGRELCLALEKMKHLHTLDITDFNKEEEEVEFLELESLMSPPQHLRHMYLEGRLRRLPVWINANSLRNLTSLSLQHSRLLPCEEEENDPLKAFQHMPNLVYLCLVKAYDGEELCCSEVGGYKNLKRLSLLKLEGLKRVRFMKGSMPMLRQLILENCPALEMVPHGIEHLSNLQELSLLRINPGLVERIRKRRPRLSPSASPQGGEAQLDEGEGGGEDCWKVQHIPKIKHLYVHNTPGGIFAVEDLQ